MSKTNQTNTPNTVGEERRRELVVQFLAKWFQQTGAPAQQKHFQAVLQTYCDSFRLWLEPQNGPSQPRVVFSVLEEYTMDATGGNVPVVLSLEGATLFRAWLRRDKMWSDAVPLPVGRP